jgi:hypothetical protein
VSVRFTCKTYLSDGPAALELTAPLVMADATTGRHRMDALGTCSDN